MHTVGGVRVLADLDHTTFDMVVIGGGITGVCVAREASAAGMSVLLVDKGDFGSGTSSATTKYIHAGMRNRCWRTRCGAASARIRRSRRLSRTTATSRFSR